MKEKNKVTCRRYLYLFIINIFPLIFSTSIFAKSNSIVIPEVNLKPAKEHVKKTPDPIQMTHFDRQEIATSPLVTLSEMLKQDQSIIRLTNNSGDSGQTALSLRGFGDNAAANSLILVDGFSFINPSLLAPNFNSVPLTDIERIDIIQGSSGTLWGDQAVGGVMNIITRHPQKLFFNSVVSFGSYGKNFDNFIVADKFNHGIFAKAYGLLNMSNNYREHNRQTDENIAAQAGVDYARGIFSVFAQSYQDSNHFPGGLNLYQYKNNPRQATDYYNNSYYKTQIVRVLSKHEISTNWILETRLTHDATQGNGFVYLPFERSDSFTDFNPRLLGLLNNNKIIFGYDGQISHYHLTNTKVQSSTSSQQNNLYLQIIFPVKPRLNVTLGARSAWQNNHIEKINHDLTDSLDKVFVTEQGISFQATSTWSLFLRRDGNFSFPKANEETWVPSYVNALNVQKGVSYETGAKWQTDKHTSQINLYRLALSDEIAFNPAQTATEPFGAFNNLDDTLRYGLTLTEVYRLNNKATLDGQLNYVDARFASGLYSGNFIPAVPALIGNAGIRYQLTPVWGARYALQYAGSRYASEDLNNVGAKLAAYWLSDVALQYTIKKMIVSFEVMNLFNQLYSTYTYFSPDTHTNTYYPGAGRNYLLTFKINID